MKIFFITHDSLSRVKLTALYKQLVALTTLTYISTNRTLHVHSGGQEEEDKPNGYYVTRQGKASFSGL